MLLFQLLFWLLFDICANHVSKITANYIVFKHKNHPPHCPSVSHLYLESP